MKKLFLLLLTIALFIVIQSSGFGQAMGCDEGNRNLVASLYAIAMTNPNSFPNDITQNRNFFVSNSQWQNCIERLSNALMQGALTGPSPDRIRERAYNIAGAANAPEMGEGLYRQMMQNRSDMLTLARHLNSLSVSIRAICDENLSTYHNSEVYQLSTSVWRAMEDAWGWKPGAVEMWRRSFFDMYNWYISQLLQAI